jgi:hypothetical protein
MVLRHEYPRPQMIREQWFNLNGEWEDTDRGLKEKWWLEFADFAQVRTYTLFSYESVDKIVNII